MNPYFAADTIVEVLYAFSLKHQILFSLHYQKMPK